MKTCAIPAIVAIGLLSSCKKKVEITVDETRVATMADAGLKVDATSNDRFQAPGDPSSSPVIAGVVPQGWLAAPASSFRLLNYRFGTTGEVYVSVSSGGLAVNINRWLGQFGQDMLDEAGVDALPTFTMLGLQGLWIEAQGDFEPGMGQEKRTNQALAGVIADDKGRIVTVKMTGPVEEVAAQKEALKVFVAGLRYR